jgi:uncharacterized membrane protein YbjE (DUF340 family)
MTRTIFLSALGAIGFGVGFALLVWVLWTLPFNYKIGSVAVAMVIGIAGMPIGEFVRRAGKYKLDKRLRIVAALTVLSAWIVGQVVANFLNLPIQLFTNIVAVIGLGIGVYIAMNRVRP